MMPAALANAVYDRMPYAPPRSYSAQSGSNVIFLAFAGEAFPPDPVRSDSAERELPEWREIALDRLARLRRLDAGWDGAGSVGVSSSVIAKADRIIALIFDGIAHPAPPAVVPCADGALQLEWWLTDTRFQLSIEADGGLEGWALDRESGHEASALDARAIELLRKWATRLTADKLAFPA